MAKKAKNTRDRKVLTKKTRRAGSVKAKSSRKKSSAKNKSVSKPKSKSKTKSKARVKSKTKAKAKSKAKTKTRLKSKARASAKSKAKPTSAAKRKAQASTRTAKAPARRAAKSNSKPKLAEERREKSLPARRVSSAKVLPRNFLFDVAAAIKEAVIPYIQSGKGADVVGRSSSGDATFEVDAVAERALLNFLKKSKQPVAYYSEDSGYTTFASGQPTNLLVVDPIDGSRAAKNGFESCVVTVCSTRVIERPTIVDVDNGCVMELMADRAFYAERGGGARVYVDGHARKPRISENKDWESLAWSMTVPARPAELIFPTAARLIDLSSLKGGFFACNSTSYSITRLLTGQLDACIDVANRFYRDMPEKTTDYFINAGRGNVIGICPYDFAAAVLIAQEAGCVLTDAYGQSFDDVLLLDSGVTNQRSLIAAASSEMHEMLLNFFDTRVQQFEALLSRR